MSSATPRVNTRARPSGETLGLQSPKEFWGGEVSFLFSPVSRDNKNRAGGSLGEDRSTVASHFPSGNQANEPPMTSANLCSGPPMAGIRNTPVLLGGRSRRNATKRPSGDHAGENSSVWP